MPTALALSPHLDDAAFSCGGTLARLARGGLAGRGRDAVHGERAGPDRLRARLPARQGARPGGRLHGAAPGRGRGGDPRRSGSNRRAGSAFREAPTAATAPRPNSSRDVRADDASRRRSRHRVPRSHRRGGAGPDPGAAGASAAMSTTSRSSAPCVPRARIGPSCGGATFPTPCGAPTRRSLCASSFAGLAPFAMSLTPAATAAKRAACAAYESQLGFQFGGVGGLHDRLAQETSDGELPAVGRPAPALPPS